jgi:hypothetical protein
LRVTIARQKEREDDLTSSDRRMRPARFGNDAGKVVPRERPV